MRSSVLFALSTVSAGALFASPAFAQTEQQQVEAQQANDAAQCSTIADPTERQACVDSQGATALPESGGPAEGTIVVTGSRIARPNFETLQPAVVINSAEIEARGFETLGQAINEQPAFGVPGASPVGNAQGGSFGSGQSFVNFLGLGDQRTLTLVNGRRFVGSNTASIFGPTAAGTQVDLNTINTKLVDRVETIAIGGAPIYGSDAIAGTVNVILKRDYEGLDVDGQMGISERGDARNYRVRVLAGHNFLDGRANLTASAEFNKGEGLLLNDRKITRQSLFEGDCPADSPHSVCVFPNRRIPSVSEGGVPIASWLVFGIPLSPEQASDVQFFGFPDVDGNGVPGTMNDVMTAFGFPGGQDSVIDPVTGLPMQFDNNGNLVPIDFGTRIGGPGSLNIDFSGGNGFNIANTGQLLTDTKRYNFNLLGSFNITDNVRLFGEGWYSYSKGTNLRNQPVYNSGLFGDPGTPDGNIAIRLDNPFLSQQARDIIEANLIQNPFYDQDFCDQFYPGEACFQLGRANTDLVSGRATSTTNLYRFVLGLDGSFTIGDRKFDWEVVGNYGRSKTEGRERVLVQQNFANAVDAVDEGVFNGGAPNGNIICRPGYVNAAIDTFNSTCSPLNLFGSGNVSQEALDYVTTEANPTGINKQKVFTASVNGPIFDLPGGDLGIALGFEHRKESTHFEPGAFYYGADDPDPLTDDNLDGDPTNDRVQFGRSIPIFPVTGSYHTNEFFGEIRAPIIGPSNDIPAIHSLELHGAARYVKHSTAGSDWTYTGEARWSIIPDIAIRGNYTRAIRAPAITEVFNPSSTFFSFAVDPCDADNLINGPDPATRAANCAVDVTQPFQSTSNQASFHQSLIGNPDLENEKSKAWSAGVVLNPRFIPGLTISADYIDIKLKDAITSFSATQVVNACYDSTTFPDNEFCDLVHRDEDGNLDFVATRYFNAAEYRYQGILGSLAYSRRTPFLGENSRIGINASYQYLKTLTQKADKDSAATTIDGSIGYPHHSAVVNINYENGPFGLFTSLNYTGKVKEDPDAPEGFYQYPKRDAVMFVNTGMSFDINKRFTFRFIVDNLFDTKPPFPSPAGGGTVSYFPGILGRYFRAGASVRF